MRDHLLITPSTLASSTLVLWSALEAYGYDAEAAFTAAGLDPTKVKNQDARYGMQAVTRLYEHIVELTGDPCFTLKLGAYWHPSNLHALGYGWLASATLKEAFLRVIRYYDIVAAGMERLYLEDTGHGYRFIIDTSEIKHATHPAEYDSFMVLVIAMCRTSYGASFKPAEVNLQRAGPVCAQEFLNYFDAPVNFSSDELSLLLPRRQMETELATANTPMARASDQVIDAYLARMDQAHTVNRVRDQLVKAMPSGKVGEEFVARNLNMSVRSLQRRLRDEGTTFSEVLDEARKELAHSYIRDKHTSINEITYLLGYSDPANFSRAFKRWTGVSPSAGRTAVS